MAKRTKKNSRNLTLDKLRGVAVFLMILAHAIVFFNFSANNTLDKISKFGDTIVFTTFLFVSGAVGYLAYINSRHIKEVVLNKAAKRSGSLLLGYYLVAIVAAMENVNNYAPKELLLRLARVLTFIEVPSYSEFILPFIIYGLLLAVFKNYWEKILSSKITVVIVGLLIYLLGAWLHTIDVPYPWFNYKAIFVGHGGIFRFPVFQYFPVLLLGLSWSRDVLEAKRSKVEITLIHFAIIIIGTVSALLLNNYIEFIDVNNLLERWPPSIFFIFAGLLFVYVITILIELTKNNTVFLVVQWGFNLLGKSAFSYYIIHILLLYIYRYSFNKQIDNVVVVITLFLLVLAAAAIITKIFNNLANPPESGQVSLFMRFIGNHKLEVGMLAVVFVLSLAFIQVYDSKGISEGNAVEGVYIDEEKDFEFEWWSDSYKAYKQLTIQNTSEDNLEQGSYVYFDIDHKSLVENKKSKQSGIDLAMVYFMEGDYKQIDIKLSKPNTKETRVYFPIYNTITSKNGSARYFLYYGNLSTQLGVTDTTSPDNIADNFTLTQSEEVLADISVKLSNKWVLKGPGVEEKDKQAVYTIAVNNIDLTEKQIVTEMKKDGDVITLKPEKIEEGKYRLRINSNTYSAGTYTIDTKIQGSKFKSRMTKFNISYPLFVTWTIDWEGFDVSQQYLDSMATISRDHKMPMVQLFNPRIFVVGEIGKERQNYLVNWVLDRQKLGDEIGLHLHMHLDMIAATGLTPKKNPRWGGRENGHDVLTSAYNYDEFYQIIEWSQNQFDLHGLPEPKSYRAGGWFIDIENLRVLNDTGFERDTSGRLYYVYGPNAQEGFWTLTSTTRPYHPSTVNQNTDDLLPLLDLWEFPNNGKDSTNNTAAELLAAFDDNYKKAPLLNAQTLTYMSHPHWFDIFDSPKMKELLTYIDKYKFERDNGPIIYTTLENAQKAF